MILHWNTLCMSLTCLAISGCGESRQTENDPTNATRDSIAAYVDSSDGLASQYHEGSCRPLKVRYFSSTSLSRTGLDLQSDDAYNFVWYGLASVSGADLKQIKKIEYLYADGTNQPRFSIRLSNGKSTTSPVYVEVPSTQLSTQWINLDIERVQHGAPFIFSPLAGIVPPDAGFGAIEFRPAKADKFRINGQEICEIMPPYVTVKVRP